MWYLFVSLLLALLVGLSYLLIKHAPKLFLLLLAVCVIFHQQLFDLEVVLHWIGWL
jgi:hypothetical protein